MTKSAQHVGAVYHLLRPCQAFSCGFFRFGSTPLHRRHLRYPGGVKKWPKVCRQPVNSRQKRGNPSLPNQREKPAGLERVRPERLAGSCRPEMAWRKCACAFLPSPRPDQRVVPARGQPNVLPWQVFVPAGVAKWAGKTRIRALGTGSLPLAACRLVRSGVWLQPLRSRCRKSVLPSKR